MRIAPSRRLWIATAVCAIGLPLTARAWLTARTDALAAHLAAAGGVATTIGAVDADLTGTIRLSDVAFGDLIAADAVEASVGLDSVLAGSVRADELRVAGPRVALAVDRDGDSDLARLARKLIARPSSGGAAGAGAGRLRRIVVSAGHLSAQVAGLGELIADGVELSPDGSGLRVVTGAVRLTGHAGPLVGQLRFARAAAELT
ncbi:MAG TPA: hypothetical protein VFP84_25445, partial [Kofleriaceae bacterium]|nr:hypothetical protein [Kofleriaceae bacterium]